MFCVLPHLTKPSLTKRALTSRMLYFPGKPSRRRDAPSLCCRRNRPLLAFVSFFVTLAKEEALAK